MANEKDRYPRVRLELHWSPVSGHPKLAGVAVAELLAVMAMAATALAAVAELLAVMAMAATALAAGNRLMIRAKQCTSLTLQFESTNS